MCSRVGTSWRPGPAVSSWLRAHSPAGSLWWSCAQWVDRGQIGFELGEEHEPAPASEPPFLRGRAPLDLLQRWGEHPEEGAVGVAHLFLRAFLRVPVGRGREQEEAQALEALRRGCSPPSRLVPCHHPPHSAELLEGVARWRLEEDPLLTHRAHLHAALARIWQVHPFKVHTQRELWALYRWCLEGPLAGGWEVPRVPHHVTALIHRGVERGEISPEALGALFSYEDEGEEILLPRSASLAQLCEGRALAPLPGEGVEALVDHLHGVGLAARAQGRAQVVGVVAPGGAGKSTLCRELGRALTARGLAVAEIGADAFLWPGEGLRYVQRGPWRETILSGPPIYDDGSLAQALARVARREAASLPPDAKLGLPGRATPAVDVALVEGVFVGWDARVAGQLDDLLYLHAADDDGQRLRRKAQRDMAPGSPRRIALLTDFAEKIYQESHDVIAPLARARATLIYDGSRALSTTVRSTRVGATMG